MSVIASAGVVRARPGPDSIAAAIALHLALVAALYWWDGGVPRPVFEPTEFPIEFVAAQPAPPSAEPERVPERPATPVSRSQSSPAQDIEQPPEPLPTPGPAPAEPAVEPQVEIPRPPEPAAAVPAAEATVPRVVLLPMPPPPRPMPSRIETVLPSPSQPQAVDAARVDTQVPPSEKSTPADAIVAAPSPGGSVARASSLDPRYLAELLERLRRLQHYPAAARRLRQEGNVLMRLELKPDGSLLQLEIAESSGYEVLDRAALDMVRRATPLPAFPVSMAREALTLTVPVVFSLREVP